MREQPVWHWLGIIPLLSGLLWLLVGWQHGWALGFSMLPGCLYLGGGVGLLLWPGDRRIPQSLAAATFPAIIFALMAAVFVGPFWCAAFIAASVAVYLIAGYASLLHEPLAPQVPAPETSLSMAAKVALDDALLGYFVMTASVPAGERARRMQRECEQITALHLERDWKSEIATFHRAPGPVGEVMQRPRSIYGQPFDHLSFPSRYEPWPGDLGADAWLAQKRNGITHAWAVRHPGPPRPWLICIHGYRMGWPALDFMLFRPGWLHHGLGLNLLMPVLPLHGPRKSGLRSGDRYIDGDFPDFIHAEAQAMHDIRSWIRWLRETADAPSIGVLGISLGGYNAALLAGLEDSLACVIAGIPLADLTTALWRHLPFLQLRYLESLGFTQTHAAEAMRVVSPLALAPRIPRERRHIFAGVADRLVIPSEVSRLARHWQTDVAWYQGTHLSFRGERAVSKCIRDALEKGGLVTTDNPEMRLVPGGARQ